MCLHLQGVYVTLGFTSGNSVQGDCTLRQVLWGLCVVEQPRGDAAGLHTEGATRNREDGRFLRLP